MNEHSAFFGVLPDNAIVISNTFYKDIKLSEYAILRDIQ